MSANQEKQNSTELIKQLIELKNSSQTWLDLCSAAISGKVSEDIIKDISGKAAASVSMVETLAGKAKDNLHTKEYMEATLNLERIVKAICESKDTEELSSLKEESDAAIQRWADAVELLIKGLIPADNDN